MRGATISRDPSTIGLFGGTMASPNDTRLPERFRAQFTVASNGCWLWTYSLNRGYARYYANRIYHRAHRYVYELLIGPIPDRLTIDHLCRVTSCVNPDHMEPVTNRVNILRGQGPAAINARKTHCIHGHEFNDENTRMSKGYRYCRTCDKTNTVKRTAKMGMNR